MSVRVEVVVLEVILPSCLAARISLLVCLDSLLRQVLQELCKIDPAVE